MKPRFWLPLIYAIASVAFVFLAGGAGHGWGGLAFFIMSLPASIVGLLFPTSSIAGLVCFAAGLFQYGLIGYYIEERSKKANE